MCFSAFGLVCAISLNLAPASATAGLVDFGNGVVLDEDQKLMWLQDGNFARTSGYHPTGGMSLQESTEWAEQLVYGGFDDWRLPSTRAQRTGYNITNSELGYLFFVHLGNLAYEDRDGNFQPGYGVTNTGPFQNFLEDWYWYGTVASKFGPGLAYNFLPALGVQGAGTMVAPHHAWAVRDVAEPGTVALFGFGLMVIGFARRKLV